MASRDIVGCVATGGVLTAGAAIVSLPILLSGGLNVRAFGVTLATIVIVATIIVWALDINLFEAKTDGKPSS